MVKNKKINIAFNGFGRIGRSLVRKLINNDNYNIVANKYDDMMNEDTPS